MVSVMLYPSMFCADLSMDLFVLCVCVFDSICELFGETIRNMFGSGCYFVVGWSCLVWLGVLCWIYYVCYLKECVLYLSSQCVSRCSFHMFCL